MKKLSLVAFIPVMLTVVNTLSNISYEALLKYAIFLTLTGAFVIIVWQHLEKEKPMVKSHYANKEKSDFVILTANLIEKRNPDRKNLTGSKREFKKLVVEATKQEPFDKK